MSFCTVCGSSLSENARFCTKCGTAVGAKGSFPTTDIIVVTTPTVPGYRITKVIDVVTGITPRTRGILGKFIGGIQSMFGGEVTAFTSEIEKARKESIERLKNKAIDLGANAVVGLDLETSDLLQTLIVISSTGTAVKIEKENITEETHVGEER